MLSTKYDFPFKDSKYSTNNNKGKCVCTCMQNRAIVGRNCLFLCKIELVQGGSLVFLLWRKRKYFFIKMFHKNIFHLNLYNLSCPLCNFLPKGEWNSLTNSLSHLKNRKWQHSHSNPGSLRTGKILQGPTCQEWPSRFTKSLCEFQIPSWWKEWEGEVQSCRMRKLFLRQLKPRLMKFQLSGIS